MFFTVYKVTNILNNKFYIGKHQTTDLNDGYMGSGKLLKRAIAKYGIENFKKEILFVFDNEADMNNKEKELVTICEQSYNLCPGGNGGFGYINKNRLWNTENHKQAAISNALIGSNKASQLSKENKEWNEKRIANIKKNHPSTKDGYVGTFKGRKHSEETRNSLKGRGNQIGSKNSQFGTCWITNGVENKKIPKSEVSVWYKLGYTRGRIIAGRAR